MNDQQFQFHLEEYKSLKTEIEYRVKGTDRIEYVLVAAMIATYAWLVSNGSDLKNNQWIWWVPVAIPIIGALRQAALLRRIVHLSEYIRTLEQVLCSKNPPTGWETFLLGKRRKELSARLISITGFVLWGALVMFSLIIAFRGGL